MVQGFYGWLSNEFIFHYLLFRSLVNVEKIEIKQQQKERRRDRYKESKLRLRETMEKINNEFLAPVQWRPVEVCNRSVNSPLKI